MCRDLGQARPNRQGQNPLGQAQPGRFGLSACTWEGRLPAFMDNPEVIIGLLIGAVLGVVVLTLLLVAFVLSLGSDLE